MRVRLYRKHGADYALIREVSTHGDGRCDAPLLEGVDTEGFAAEPAQVVPDAAYTPLWAREGESGSASFQPGRISRPSVRSST